MSPGHVRSRRRGPELEHALYEAALAELVEVGYGRLTMEGVAARARTGKAAVYRRWSSRQALVLDAVRHSMPPLPGFDPAMPPRDNLRVVFGKLCGVFAGETSFPGLAVITGLLGDSALRDTFVEAIVRPRLQVIESILAHAEQTGDVAPGALSPLAPHIGPAMIMHSFLLTGAAPSEADITRIIDIVLP
ncbi:TetR/AcrR family transcriptional regulator [Kutzneria sp. CA-103260]|uniref:TetR/AcrR family transcriptional regulator n=1 Tax=Kutzneria sp. CA-103260 TaxID=2802641 RepID=UPI001BA71A52|nr:TetR/AcrR family transcriptional regulator [Kutzneria sp. CA-103260]